MPRGQTSVVGDTRVAKNGYHYTKTEDRGWVLTHWLTAEKKLGRPIDSETEMVKFRSPKFKSDPYNLDGIEIIKKRTVNLRKRLAQIEVRIQELEAEKASIEAQLSTRR